MVVISGEFHLGERTEYGEIPGPPEFVVMHDKGNEEKYFDRVDYQLSTKDSIHLQSRL